MGERAREACIINPDADRRVAAVCGAPGLYLGQFENPPRPEPRGRGEPALLGIDVYTGGFPLNRADCTTARRVRPKICDFRRGNSRKELEFQNWKRASYLEFGSLIGVTFDFGK